MERVGQYLARLVDSTKEHPSIWEAGKFEEYLKSIGRNKENLLSSDKYPEEIVLSDGFHSELNEIRKSLKTKIEHYKLLGYDRSRDELLIPNLSSGGIKHSIPLDIIQEQVSKYNDRGINTFIGDIHTHPTPIINADGNKELAAFSTTDLYGLIFNAPDLAFRIVIDDQENLLALKTRETLEHSFNPILVNEEVFNRYWLQKGNYSSSTEGGIRVSDGILPYVTNISMDIAERHKLALYAGEVDGPLYRFSS